MSDAIPTVFEAEELEIEYHVPGGRVRALDSATLAVAQGEITAIVGESGSGKTTLGMAAGRLLPSNSRSVGGNLRVLGQSVLECDRSTLRRLRRDALGFIFQNPVAALNPTIRIGRQMTLAAEGASIEGALREVGLADVDRVMRAFPHELSGGMAQRVGIAMALLRSPILLIADEPTASVDSRLRGQILELIVTRCRERSAALILLTHDLHAVAIWCTRIAVMYAGRVVEVGSTADVLANPLHPYTRALLDAVPGHERAGERLKPIAGSPPVLADRSSGCAFAPRCPNVMPHCALRRPESRRVAARNVLCHLYSSFAAEELPEALSCSSQGVELVSKGVRR